MYPDQIDKLLNHILNYAKCMKSLLSGAERKRHLNRVLMANGNEAREKEGKKGGKRRGQK
jgi:hypothetical protein